MKVRYQREMKRNYLIIEPEEEYGQQGYVSQMMSANRIDGLLRFSLRQVDGRPAYYYEITSKQPLCRLLENRTIHGEELRRLVLGISGVLTQLERYLLPENSIWLEPESLYLEPETFRIWVCLIPGREERFSGSLEKLLEYLLGKVDHQHKDSVVLAYGLYQETRKEDYGIQDLLRLLYQTDQKLVEETPQAYQKPASTSDTLEQEPGRKELLLAEEKKKDRFWNRFSGKKKELEKRTAKGEEGEHSAVPWNLIFPQEVSVVRETPPEEDGYLSGENTELLYDASSKEEIRRFRALGEGEEDIPIFYYPFIIGKQENLVDYVLKKEAVSRLHLRIDRESGNYRVTDLNSTNGTVVRGNLLENNDSVLIHPGDDLQIAGNRYRFE